MMLFRGFLEDWKSLSSAGRVLVLNGFTFNLGFYMMLPYLADHLEQDLGLSGWYVGFIIGLRVLSQQGLFLVGGTLGDYFGYKHTILVGCAVRVVGFAFLGVGDEFAVLVVGAFLSGFAGALFTPSSQAYLASEYPKQQERDRIFALQNVTSEAGMLLGPLVGLSLLMLSFSWIGLLSAGFFSLLLVVQWYYLPNSQSANVDCDTAHDTSPFWVQWRSMIHNKPFMYFVGFASVYPLLFHQLYMAIPSEIRTLTDDVRIITWVFATSSIMGVLLQIPISRFVEKVLGTALGMGLGMSLMGSSYLWLSLPILWFPALPFLICAVFFSMGSMLVFPLLGAYVPRFCSTDQLGRYYGLYACIGGVYAFVGNVLIGWLLSIASLDHSWIWIGLFLISCIAGKGLYQQMQRGVKKTLLYQ
ncbi:MDR family MFS transporter [Marinomonas sp. 2405UD68-3]|uniref:MDR family MFS transporter n=1 Tax=Marinomonas sp. 2405UD68-3 TaxID=3391835 RepID=UPI0039C8FC40